MVLFTICQSAIEGVVTYHYVVGGWGDTAVLDSYGPSRAYEVMSDLRTTLIALRECLFYISL
jgi:hypothetical protein